MGDVGHVIVATGVNREAAVIRQSGVVTVVSGGDPVRLRAALAAAGDGAVGIMSFGMAGALADGLAVGDWVVGNRLLGAIEMDCDPAWRDALLATLPAGRAGDFYADGRMIDTVPTKVALGTRYGCLAVDMESHIAGSFAIERGLPFAIVRCVSDGARHSLPHAITVSMRPDGGIDGQAMFRSLAMRPGQIVDIARTTARFARAMRALKRGAARIGPRMALPLAD